LRSDPRASGAVEGALIVSGDDPYRLDGDGDDDGYGCE
jgi:hypothetical protein